MKTEKKICAYDGCGKKFKQNSPKQLYCSDVCRVYANRKKNAGKEKPVPQNAFEVFCASIGANSDEVLTWVKVNYPKRDAQPKREEKKSKFKQTSLPLPSDFKKAKDIVAVTKGGESVSLADALSNKADKKEEPPKRGSNTFLEQRRKTMLGL